MAETVPMTIATVGPPVTAVSDGAQTACPVALVDGLTVVVGDRVVAQVRTPRMPLVTSKETTT